MRGEDGRQRVMLVVINPEQRVLQGHPLRRIKALADAALAQLSPLFDETYSTVGRPSIPPERLLKASLLMALYTVRSEAAVVRATGLQLSVPLVSGPGGRRGELRALDLFAQPHAAVGARGGG